MIVTNHRLHRLSNNSKIKEVESRLASVESLLRDLSNRLVSTPSMSPSLRERGISREIPGVGSSLTISPGATSGPDTSLSFARGPILAEQRTFANKFLETALQESPPCDISPEMERALADLRQIVELQNSQSSDEGVIEFPFEQPIPHGGLSEMPMPPLETVVSLWTRLKGMKSHIRTASPDKRLGHELTLIFSQSPVSLHITVLSSRGH